MTGLGARVGRVSGVVYHDQRLPFVEITRAEFSALPEYSFTLPTGPRPGKRWRRHVRAHGTVAAFWVIAEAYALPRTTDVGIRWAVPQFKE